MAWTKLKVAVGVGVAAVVILQWHQIATQKQVLAALQEQQALQSTRNSTLTRPGPTQAEDKELRQLRAETARLSNELLQMRDQLTAQSQVAPAVQTVQRAGSSATNPPAKPEQPGPDAPVQSQENAPSGPTTDEVARQLGLAAAQGDPAALKRLEDYARAAGKSLSTNGDKMSDNEKAALAQQLFKPLWSAFDVITEEGKKGSTSALQALSLAAVTPGLTGSAVKSIGVLAGAGNESALEILLNPGQHNILTSSAVGALKPAADSGNQRAIDALAAVVAEPNNHPLWYMAAEGLKKSVESGNAAAIDTFINLSVSTNQSLRGIVIPALSAAARHGNPKASAAIQRITAP
jgi:hypothetical protein